MLPNRISIGKKRFIKFEKTTTATYKKELEDLLKWLVFANIAIS